MKQAGPEFLTGVEFKQEKVSQTGEFSIEPTFYNHLNRVRESVTTPEHSLHRYTLTSELHSGHFHDKFHSHTQIGISSQLSLELHQLPIGHKNPKKQNQPNQK